jgi:hypothetical protein
MKPDVFTIITSEQHNTYLRRNGNDQCCPYRDMNCSSKCALFVIEWSKIECRSEDESIAAQIKVVPTAVVLGCSNIKIGLDYEQMS